MKTFTLTLAALLFTLGSHATVITVDNNPNSPADYSDLQTAVDSSISGDTLYVHGSQNSYGNITIKHAITLVGAGFNPDNQWQLTSEVQDITLGVKSGLTGPIDDASGTRIIGLVFNSLQENGTGNNPINNVKISRSRSIQGIDVVSTTNNPTGSSGWVVVNNLLRGNIRLEHNNVAATNVVIKNNVFINNARIFQSDQTSVLVTHNVFHHSSSSSTSTAINYCNYLTFTNNILINTDVGSGTDNEFCTFKNNITNTTSQFVYGNNTGSGNMVQTNPLLVDISNGFQDPLLNDYTLQSSSPAIDAGTDTTDIGITGGANPFTVYGQDMPAFPQVIKMNILNMNIPVNDTLQIEIRARNQE